MYLLVVNPILVRFIFYGGIRLKLYLNTFFAVAYSVLNSSLLIYAMLRYFGKI